MQALVLTLIAILFNLGPIICVSQDLSNDSIRHDFIKSDIDIPAEYIRDHWITVFYYANEAFAHLHYKRYEEAFMPCTYVAIYQRCESRWKFVKVIPYNYEMEKVDDNEPIFLSNNEFCGMTGICSYYSQISCYVDDTMEDVVGFPGYDHTVNYIHRIFTLEEHYKPLQGDTILNKRTISNVRVGKAGFITYDLLREVGVFKGINADSLIIDRVSRKHTAIEVDLQKAIIENKQ